MKSEIAEISDQVREFLKPIFGKTCCRQRVSEPRGLRLGFGERVFHGNPKLIDPYYGEWEIGTYYCAWRVVKAGRVICGSDDSVESAHELNATVQQIEFGAIQSIEQLSSLDVRIGFDTAIVLDFLATTADDSDECLGIIHSPSHRSAEFRASNGWVVGASNQPWQR